ncbi:hypothetical protein [Enterocloster sp.]
MNFYWDYYSQGKCCYVKMEYPDLEQVVDMVHRNKVVRYRPTPALT